MNAEPSLSEVVSTNRYLLLQLQYMNLKMNISVLKTDASRLHAENTRIKTLVEELVAQGAILPEVAKRFFALEPFPQ